MRRKPARHKILIQSDVHFDKTSKADGSIIIVSQNKRQIQEIITSCLEEQLDVTRLVGKTQTCSFKQKTSEIIAEIEAIRKQLILDTGNNTAAPDASCNDTNSIVPNDVKEYLFR